MRATLSFRMGLVLLVASSLVGARPAVADEFPEFDEFHLVLLAPAQPVFIRLEAQADGTGLRGMRAKYAKKLFERYDADHDGLLTKEEAANIPPIVKAAGMAETFSIVDTWVSVDSRPADDRVSLEELTDYIDRILGSPLVVSVRAQRTTQSIDMFELLDTNHDGRLSLEELRNAATTLRKLDADDDESLTVDELLGMRTAGVPGMPVAMAEKQTSDVPILQLSSEQAIAETAQRLLERYGDAGAAEKGLEQSRLGISLDEFQTADANDNGRVELDELKKLLSAPPARLVLKLELFQAKKGRPQWTVVDDPLKIATRTGKGTAEKLQLATNGVAVELRAASTRGAASDTRKFFQQRFRQVDADKNKYLGEQEFAMLANDLAQAGLQNITFKMVDRDGNEMITDEELLALIDQDSSAQQSRVELVISHDGESVFEVLGGKLDRRLTARELAAGAELMKKFDLDGDGTISPVEMVGRYRMLAELGKPALFRIGTNGPRAVNDTQAMVIPANSGPGWFRKMDRNRDGDVSKREFLGSRALFESLDTNHDGLISAAEADTVSPDAN